MINNKHMERALELAAQAAQKGEVPVGAIIVDSQSGKVISEGTNLILKDHDPTAHAEIIAIRRACKSVKSERLPECDLYVTLEPCPMCAQAISFARIRRLYFAAYDEKGGGVENGAHIFNAKSCHHKPDVYGGIGERRASDMLRDFFKQRR